jgi:alkyl sulfatase BDS1-like metallo-beta-lactamase superfamily hydrolase
MISFLGLSLSLQGLADDRKGASAETKSANSNYLTRLPFQDTRDFDDSAQGLLFHPETLTIP